MKDFFLLLQETKLILGGYKMCGRLSKRTKYVGQSIGYFYCSFSWLSSVFKFVSVSPRLLTWHRFEVTRRNGSLCSLYTKERQLDAPLVYCISRLYVCSSIGNSNTEPSQGDKRLIERLKKRPRQRHMETDDHLQSAVEHTVLKLETQSYLRFIWRHCRKNTLNFALPVRRV
jgi:hypothetical protein